MIYEADRHGIKRAKPKEKVYTLADGNGLSLLVDTNGSKGWRYRNQFGGKTKMISLGIYPVVSLTEARTKRDEARKADKAAAVS